MASARRQSYRSSQSLRLHCNRIFLTMTVLQSQGKTAHTNCTNTQEATSSDRILSIQSHVAFGYVGGKAAVFPLQCMGYDVDVVNTVNFSNHSGYGHFGGTKTNEAELTRIFDFMDKTGVLISSRLLTGYIPNAESVSAVQNLVEKLKARSPDLIYLLDPVLGDSGKLYVAPDVVPIYQQMLSSATIITPNWFEVEVLTNTKLTDISSLRTALRKLHTDYGVPQVVVSSIPLCRLAISMPKYLLPSNHPVSPVNGSGSDDSQITSTPTNEPSFLLCIASSLNTSDDSTTPLSTVYARCVPLIPGYFSGVGDLFSALLLGHFRPPSGVISSGTPTVGTKSLSHARSLAVATSHALSKTHAILSLTHVAAAAQSLPPTDDELDAREPERKSKRMKGRELRLIQGQDLFRSREPVEDMSLWEGFWEDSQ
ncbi:Ribokinase-like protein [Phlebopus sp. FC_14]|nr:Ribokinase-like protein [Phlebopus sp. FC_14]